MSGDLDRLLSHRLHRGPCVACDEIKARLARLALAEKVVEAIRGDIKAKDRYHCDGCGDRLNGGPPEDGCPGHDWISETTRGSLAAYDAAQAQPDAGQGQKGEGK